MGGICKLRLSRYRWRTLLSHVIETSKRRASRLSARKTVEPSNTASQIESHPCSPGVQGPLLGRSRSGDGRQTEQFFVDEGQLRSQDRPTVARAHGGIRGIATSAALVGV